MATIMPHGEDIRKAVQWVSEVRQSSPEKNLGKLIEDASIRFNLSPAEYESLLKFFNGTEGPIG